MSRTELLNRMAADLVADVEFMLTHVRSVKERWAWFEKNVFPHLPDADRKFLEDKEEEWTGKMNRWLEELDG